QQALSDGDYTAALQLDPSNAEALSMKKAAIQAALSDGDYALALRLNPSNAQARERVLNLPPITNSIGMKLKLLSPGSFRMGSPAGNSDERPHGVTLTQAFTLGVHEVTQAQYERVMGVNPSIIKGADKPVQRVSWGDAVKFCRKLSDQPPEKAAGNIYRLPTEAEWEYACRAGTATSYTFGNIESLLGDHAWYRSNSGGKINPVGVKQPNSWGLYDMQGNVSEWCQDWLGVYPSSTAMDPTGAVSGSYRVLRGGGWSSTAGGCRSASRSGDFPADRDASTGFRVCLSLSGQ
ncbi:formylglycine-generating enzyme family protein, partial [Rubripirellula sp.]